MIRHNYKTIITLHHRCFPYQVDTFHRAKGIQLLHWQTVCGIKSPLTIPYEGWLMIMMLKGG